LGTTEQREKQGYKKEFFHQHNLNKILEHLFFGIVLKNDEKINIQSSRTCFGTSQD